VAGRGLGLALLLILPAAVPAAAAEASLQVRVVDASHRALAEVSATLASIDEAGAAYTARAEAGGVLAFYDVGPGAYRLRVEHAGLSPATSDLRLGPGETGWLTAVLAGGALVAMIQGPDNKTYIVHPGDKLLDGAIKSITPQGLVIEQEVNDPLSVVKQREIRKLLRGLEDAK